VAGNQGFAGPAVPVVREYYDSLEEKTEVKLHGAATGASA
jgi:hypothetical protein